ncbi:insulinase family protein [bacterium]|nr:insulinase family protein [bacterium]
MSIKNLLIPFNLVFFILAGLSSPLSSQDQGSLFPVEHHELQNGLQVILSEDYSVPVVSVVIAYQVGSIHEKPGKSGIAYLLENLMFQGSENVGPMQHINFIHRMGGNLNAVTTEDQTLFYQKVPSNQLAPVLWLEADRMKSLKITSSKVKKAKTALIQEIQQRKNKDPYLESSLYFDRLLYPHFIYHHPIFGNESSIREITPGDVKEFYSSYYTPNNAVLCIVGHINKKKSMEMVKKYFGTIPKGKEIPSMALRNFSLEEQTTRTVENPLASSPGFYLGYRLPSPYSDYYYPLKIIEYILIKGDSSRLHERLIKKEHIATHLHGEIEKKKNLAAFKIFVLTNNQITRKMSRKAIFSEINKLKSTAISEDELRKAKNLLRRNYTYQYSSTLNKAIFLSEKFLERKKLNFQVELEKYLSVTPNQITRIMNKYFGPHYFLLNVNIK